MRVIRARSAGFCLGVSLALRRLDQELDADRNGTEREKRSGARGRLITLGPIIHNPLVMREYLERGVLCEDDPQGIGPGDRAVIRAHGIPRDVEARLRASGATIIDATCPKVKKAQLAIGGESAKGGFLLLFGEKDHPEVRGLLSYAGERSLVFGDLRELDGFALAEDQSYFLAAQTTQDRRVFLQAERRLEKRLGRRVPTLPTICDATRDRQREVIELSGKVEAMVVVGGLNSGNTRRLAEVARANGIPAIHVEQAEDMTPELVAGTFAGISRIGLTAGASTPENHIHAMQAWLENL
jgi:4-hydroxy-3-methylbut-2-enyl diphosphate reductase